MMKKLLVFCVVIIAVIAVLIGVAASQSGTIIRHAVEEFGPDITGTSVTLSDVNVSVLSGNATIKNLVIGNPKGFKSDSAIKVGEVAVKLDVKSLFSDKININKILIDGAELTYELGKGGSNISQLQKNIEQRTAALVGDQSKATEGSAQATEAGPNVVIEDVFINGTKVNLVASLLGGKGAGTTIPDIHLEDIGKDEGGASPADAAKEVFGALTKTVGTSVSKIVPADQIKDTVNKAVEKNLKSVEGKIKGLFGK